MKYLVRLAIFSILLVLAAVVTIGYTSAGLQLVVKSVNRLFPDHVRVESCSGALFTAFTLQGVEVEVPKVTIRVGEVTTSWNPFDLLKNKLFLFDSTGAEVDIIIHKGDGKPLLELPQATMPFTLLVDYLEVENLRFYYGTKQFLAFQQAAVGYEFGGQKMVFTKGQFRHHQWSGKLKGELGTTSLWKIHFDGEAVYDHDKLEPVKGSFSLDGGLPAMQADIDILHPAAAKLNLRLSDTFIDAKVRALLKVPELQLQRLNSKLFPVIISAESDLLYDFKHYEGTTTSLLRHPEYKDLQVSTRLAGDFQKTVLTDCSGTGDWGEAVLTDTTIFWGENTTWQGQLSFEEMVVPFFNQYNLGAVTGKLSVDGNYSSDHFEITSKVQQLSTSFKETPVVGDGKVTVNSTSLEFEDFLLRSGEGHLTVQGVGQWQDSPDSATLIKSWVGQLSATKFDPALFIPGYPGEISAEVTGEGQFGKDSRLQFEIEKLVGTLRDYPVQGRGIFRKDGELLNFQDIVFNSGNSSITVDGILRDTIELQFAVSSDNLGELLQDASGRIRLDGDLRGTRKQPHFTAHLEGEDLTYNKVKVVAILGDFSGGVPTEMPIHAEVVGAGLSYDNMELDHIDLQVDGLTKEHRTTLRFETLGNVYSFMAKGGLNSSNQWVGSILNGNVKDKLYGSWIQSGAAKVKASLNEVIFDQLCLQSSQEKICTQGEYSQQQKEWSVTADWQSFDLARLNKFSFLPEPVKGKSSGELTTTGDWNKLKSARVKVSVQDCGLDYVDEDLLDLFKITQGKFDLVLENTLLQTNSKLQFGDGSTVKLKAQIANFGSYTIDPEALELVGETDLMVQDISFLAPLTEYSVIPSGRLEGKMDLSGPLSMPLFDGGLELSGGKIDLPAWGVSLTSATFDVAARKGGMEIQGGAISGDGEISLKGELAYDHDGLAGDFRFFGEHVDTIMLPEYEVRTSPDLRLLFTEHGGSLSGVVVVDEANLTPEEMTDTMDISEDVILVNGGSIEESTSSRWPLATAIKVDLGQNCLVEGYGLEGYLRGGLMVSKEAGSHMTGKGVVRFEEGVFSVYGRHLEIVRGKLHFTGGPIDNPGVDVRAQKIVAARDMSSGDLKVGVDVSGTADDLEYKLFSSPAMDESDILAYMIVGRSMSDTGKEEENLLSSVAVALGLEGSVELVQTLTNILPVDDVYFTTGTDADDMVLEVGKKLTDKLYIGYDHNFFEQKGEVKLRYELGKGFSAETRSSADATGADILFSFER